MGLQVKINKSNGKFRFWTTISDGWLTGWITKYAAKKFLQKRVMDEAQRECEEIAAKFPHGYFDTKSRMIVDKKGEERLQKLLESRIY